MVSGAPDWQRVFTLVPPSMTHGAPDWERTAVGPSGAPIGGITALGHLAAATFPIPANTRVDLGTLVCSNTAPGYAMVGLGGLVNFTTTVAAANGIELVTSGDLVAYGPGLEPYIEDYPGVIVTGRQVFLTWCGLVDLTAANAAIDVYVQSTLHCSGTIFTGGYFLGVWQ